MAEERTAEFVRNLEGFRGEVKLYKLSKPVPYYNYSEEPLPLTDHIVISAVNFPMETFIFPATSNGEVINWAELPGSEKYIMDHDRALANFLEDHKDI